MALDTAAAARASCLLVSEHGVPGSATSVLVDGEITDAEAGVVNIRTGVKVLQDSCCS